MSELVGKRLGQYDIQSVLGTGGMAVVYKARQESMDRDVAIKVIGGQLAGNPDFVARFEREARLIAKLQHPHILPVYDFGRHDGLLYLVMRLVEGGSLDQRLRHGALPVTQAARVVTQIASALTYAHDQGIIHRDLKPNNILLDTKDNPYLTDFGIAKLAQEGDATGRLTATGTVLGTPSYMAPEQWRGENIDARTDIYALGVMLYEMLTGDLPFTGDTPYALMYKHFDAPPPSPRLRQPSLPEAINDVINRALAKRKEERYASADTLAHDLNAVLSGAPISSIQPNITSETEATFIGDVPTATGKVTGRTAIPHVKTAPGIDAVNQPVMKSTGRLPLYIALGVVLLLLVGGGLLFSSQAAANTSATATQIALVGQTETQAANAAATSTAIARIPTATATSALPTAVRFTDYTDTELNIKFRVPEGWEVQKKQGYGVFIVERFSNLIFPDDSDTSTPVLGAPYLQFAVGNHTAFGVQDMATAKTATDAMLAWFGGERLQNLDLVFGTRFETATTTRPRQEHNVVRTNYLMLLGPDRFATLLVQAPPDQIDNIENAIALPLIRSLDHIIAPTKAVIPTETPTPVVSATFEMPTVFDTHQSPQMGVDIDFPKGWSSFESDESVIFSFDQQNMDVNNVDSSPYIVIFKRKKAELRNYRPEYSIVDIFRENLGALSKNPQEVTGVPFPTAIGRSLGDSTLTLNGWLILVMLDEDNYLEFFAQAPRASEDVFRDQVLIPMLKSLKLN